VDTGRPSTAQAPAQGPADQFRLFQSDRAAPLGVPVKHGPTVFSHRLLAQRHPIEMEHARCYFRRLTAGDPHVAQVAIEHCDDGVCCTIEPWPQTMVAILTGEDGDVFAGQRTQGAQ
jgi:hypothetical protein